MKKKLKWAEKNQSINQKKKEEAQLLAFLWREAKAEELTITFIS